MKKTAADVRAFLDKFAVPQESEPRIMPPDVMEFRLGHLKEELTEAADAAVAGDVEQLFDAMIDLIYVATGTLIMMGLDDEAIIAGWNEVQRANMSKKRVESADKSKRGHSYDVVKPEGWTPPDIAGVVVECRRRLGVE